MKNKFNSRMIAEISMLLALGFVLKLVTDLLTRSVASFLFVDFLLLITVVVLYRYPLFKVAVAVAFVETIVSATLFTMTDMWFVRPVIVLIAFVVIRIIQKRSWKERNKFIWACFFTSKLTIIAVSAILMGILFVSPDLLGLDAALAQLSDSMLSTEQVLFLEENLVLLLACSLVLLAFLYSYIPAFVHLFLGMLAFKALQKIENKK